MKILLLLVCGIIGLIVVGWLGLQIPSKPFAAFGQRTPPLRIMPLPDDLPAPVARFYRELYGEAIPVIESAVLTGRARMRLKGVSFTARFRFTHEAGRNYRHYIEATWFGLPILKINEHYLDGRSRFELPFGVLDNDANTNQGANLALWAEAIWFPSVFLTDPRVQWEPLDDMTAVLVVPFADQTERLLVRFDPQTGLLTLVESMRYKNPDDPRKILWLNEARAWAEVGGYRLPTVGAVTWLDEGRPWAIFTVEDAIYNVDVRDSVRATGL
jgi:hypothetical protein